MSTSWSQLGGIIFPVTYKCNLKCSYCKERLKLDIHSVAKSIDVIKNLPNEWVYITGGEPLLLENIFEICDELRLTKKVGLTTNGTIPKFEISDHVDRLGVSIDGPEHINDEYRGEGTFKTAHRFLSSVSNKCETGIMCTVGYWNKNHTSEIEEIGKQAGCDFVQFTDVSI